ncbi:hypothetical protein ACFYWN_46750 [Streptomyces sp. NPDC002917]|uniref:hypothetical protein n=1 Tax=Streptomyces sp. NPDC002917 TaxID=3364671 RepID=UPI003677AA79
MLWPALRALAYGHLTSDQLTWLLDNFGLTKNVRVEGPGAAQSTAHRPLVDEQGTALVLDLARTGDSGWVLTLFHNGQQPAAATIEGYRKGFRDAVRQLELTLVQVEPPASADEVLTTPAAPDEANSPFGPHWDPAVGQLGRLWTHLGLDRQAPGVVKAVKLREVMLTPAWPQAPGSLHREAEEFLRNV